MTFHMLAVTQLGQLKAKIVSGPFLPVVPLVKLHVSDFSEECVLALELPMAGIFIQIVHLTKLTPTQPPSWTYPCSPLNACCREFHYH